ncbi:MAG TPA: DNA ligase D [Pirellulaceae bacterium]|nr:DNA ligase D [Pirellulaceae bacterium]
MSLVEYRRKRHFDKTPEPGAGRAKRTPSQRLKYVIQKHAARRLHYDLRLELEGVHKSWAVPKGPSLDPGEKRLAVQVEDHPLDYGKFEGRIPEGEYGAGEVIIWDRGTWKPVGDPMQGFREGKLEFELNGEKLNGGWLLLRMRGGSRRSDKPQWLLIKKRDAAARPLREGDILEEQPQSVKSGRRLGDPPGKPAATSKPRVRRAKASPASSQTVPSVKRELRCGTRPSAPRSINPAALTGARRAPLRGWIEPQLATLVPTPPSGDQWLHEIKFDGYRLLAVVNRGRVQLWTRGQQDWTDRYPVFATSLAALPAKNAMLDGEVVALLPSGVSSFQALQNAMRDSRASQLWFYVFDLLYLDGYDLRDAPLEDRKSLLERTLSAASLPQVRLSEHFAADGPKLLAESCRLGLEGIVSKRADRPYVSGRSSDWLKSKCISREELIIGGYTISEKIPRGIGALLVGYFDKGKLVYAGRVGTGFTSRTHAELRQRLEMMRQKENPFVSVPAKERVPQVRWVRPQLVAQVAFTGWTEANVLRHPSFEGLREDKPAASVSRPPTLKNTPAVGDSRQAKGASMTKAATARKSKSKGRRAQVAASSSVKLTNPDRVLYPDIGLTKQGLADYYLQVAPWMLPHVVDRPLSLVRCPEGKSGKCFFQKHSAAGTPEELGRIDIREKDETEEYLYIHNVDGLVALAQMSVLEIHVWGSRRDQIECPDRLVMDLDPHEALPWQTVVDAAHEMRELLDKLKLKCFPRLTGGKGIHVVVPIAPRRHDWPAVKAFAKSLADDLAARFPDRYVANMSKAARKGKIFVDYLRNDRGATAIASYSTRAKAGAPVATPVSWDELTPELAPDQFHVGNLMGRLASLARDPWHGIDRIKQMLPEID